jgi:hypothetical protein
VRPALAARLAARPAARPAARAAAPPAALAAALVADCSLADLDLDRDLVEAPEVGESRRGAGLVSERRETCSVLKEKASTDRYWLYDTNGAA